MTISILRNKNLTRPRKGGAAGRRRELEQRKRLQAVGYTEAQLKKMNTQQIRTLLKRPAKLQKKAAAAK